MKISLHRLGGPANPQPWLVLCALALLPIFAQTGRAASPRQTPVPGYVPAADGVPNVAPAQAHPAVAAFSHWSDRFAAASGPAARTPMLGEGLSLARQRRAALAELIKSNPRAAIASAVPISVRQQLPADVAAELETRVSGIGELSVLAFLQAKGGPAVQPIDRTVRLDGQTYHAYVYGRRASQTSKSGIPLSGIAVGDVLALSDSAIRELEPGETPESGKAVIELKGSGQPSAAGSKPTLAEVGGKIYRFASSQELQQAETRLEAAEAGLNPTPAQSAADLLQSGDLSAPQGLPKAPPSPWTTGLKNILVIRVDFSDLQGDPATAAFCQTLMDGAVASYYVKSSYGLTSLTNTVTTQLYRMPQTAVAYATGGLNAQLHLDAEAAAAANYTLANYDRIVVLFAWLGNIPGSLITYGGLANVVGPDVWVNGEFDFRIMSHELGHTYGLWHAGLWLVTDGNPISPSGTTVEYGDDFDTMGANFANDQNTDFSGFNKNILGWMPDSEVRTVTTNGVYRLYAFDWANFAAATNNPTLALTMVKDSDRTYWFGVRRNFTSNPTMANGAYVIWGLNSVGGGSGGGFNSQLLDLNTPGFAPSAGVNSDYDAALTVGQTFNDPAINFKIQAIAEGGTWPDQYLDLLFGDVLGLQVVTNYVTGGNGNGVIDPDECNSFFVVLANTGALGATNIHATLSTTTPGVAVSQPFSFYPDMPAGTIATNLTPFQISTSPSFLCGAPINLTLLVKTDQATVSNYFTIFSGLPGTPIRADNSVPLPIPDGSALGAYSAVTVSNVAAAISKVTVSLQINHTYDSDLLIQLISPDGTTNLLTAGNGGAGQNYGVTCAPDSFRTTFDDDAPTSISVGVPPFTGLFKPQQPLAVFAGKSGTNINGTWLLRVVDDLAVFSGTLNCWSLNLIPAQCPDGGGQCPGADLAIGMTAVPSPVVASNYMTYSISVTNNGPSSARNVSVSQVLPSGVTFVSAVSSQGACSQSGGVVTCKLAAMDLRATATIAVVVQPMTPGTISSTATVSSELPDPVPANNSAVVVTQVLPVASDLAASIAAAPPTPLAGAPMTYTVTVVNNGPSTATGVMATNVLPAGFAVGSPTPSQGHVTVFGNVVVWFLDSSLLGGASANLTIPVIPPTNGTFTATTRVTGDQNDPNVSNNFASVTTAVGPSSDLAVGLVGLPNPVVLQSRLTYKVVVTNLGPSTASGVVLNGSLPTSIDVTSNYVSQGSLSVSTGALFADLGTLASGATATVVLYTTPNLPGTVVASVNVAASQADPNPANNTVTVSTIVSRPFISVVQAGAQLVGESFAPPDGAIEVGEIVTNSFRLQNVGNVNTTNIVATLLATNGIIPLNPATHAPLASYSQTYGVLAPSGFAVGRSFTFIASATNGPTVGATFQVQDTVGGYSTNLTFTFVLPTSSTFTNTNAILIPDPAAPNPPYASQSGPASPYPSTLAVSGLSNTVSRVTVTLSNLTHSFIQDVSALLVGPSGAKTLLMSHAGWPNGVANVNLTFGDSALAPLPASGSVSSGFWQPSGYNPPVFPGGAPAGPYLTSLSTFSGLDPNGSWTLYLFDDGAGDPGQIAQGWSLTFANVTPINPLVDLTLSEVAVPNPVTVNSPLTCTFTVSNAGPVAASGVTLSNAIPQTAALFSATSSVGSCTTNGGVVLCSIPSLAPGSNAVVTVVMAPSAIGSLTNTASVSSLATDLHAADNTASAVVAVNPQPTDVALAITSPATVVIGSNLTYTITVTNSGPGAALSVAVTNPLPANVSFVTSSSSQASATLFGTNLVSNFGAIPANTKATNQVVVKALQLGVFTNFASASLPANQADLNPTNNSAVALIQIVPPFLNIVVGGVSLTIESGPTNGVIDAGERVTVQFGLQNLGTIPNTNLTVTLQAGGGVISPSGSQNYGQLLPGAAPVSRPFSFTASSTVGASLTATLHLQDSGGLVTDLTFRFTVGNGFTNANAISIAQHGAASPYPSTISLSGLTGVVSKVAVTLYGLTHSFSSDVNVLLVNPAGASVVLMSHAGGAHSVTNATLTFDDTNSVALLSTAAITSGAYRPSAYGSVVFPPPAPATPYGSSLAALNGIDAGGTNIWSLFVYDDSNGDAGTIASGWSLNVTTFNPLLPVADLAVGIKASPASVFPHGAAAYMLTVTNLGPSTATNVFVTEQVPASFTVLSNRTTQGANFISGATLTNNIGTLLAGAGATVTLFAAPPHSGTFTATATVAGNVIDLNLANNTASTSILVNPEGVFSGYYSGGLFHLTVNGVPGGTLYSIQASTDLACSTCWTTIATTVAPDFGPLTVTDSNTPSFTRRYYRAVRLTP